MKYIIEVDVPDGSVVDSADDLKIYLEVRISGAIRVIGVVEKPQFKSQLVGVREGGHGGSHAI